MTATDQFEYNNRTRH